MLPRFATTQMCSFATKSKSKADVAKYIKRQMTDPYSRKAREHSYRARSAFKLMEIDDRYNLLKPDSVVLDIGCAPGSWLQVVVERCGLDQPSTSGYALGVDLQLVLPIKGADVISLSDVTAPATLEEIKKRVSNRPIDVILSDMAPNSCGDGATDHLRLINLCRHVYGLFHNHGTAERTPTSIELSRHGVFCCKMFDGELRQTFMRELGERFRSVRSVKPQASRDASSEFYLLCTQPRF